MALVDSIVVRCLRVDDYNICVHLSSRTLTFFIFNVVSFFTFKPQRFCVTALVAGYVPNFSHVVFWVFVSGGVHLFPLYILMCRYQ